MRQNDRLRDFVTSGARTRVRQGSLRVVLAGIATAVLATGCLMQDAICRSEEYPVKAVGNLHGAACQTKDKEPPPGFVRYPEGKVPKHVDDEWDRYWSTKIVDSNGNIVNQNSPEGSTAPPS
jgi:hypothetical protein